MNTCNIVVKGSLFVSSIDHRGNQPSPGKLVIRVSDVATAIDLESAIVTPLYVTVNIGIDPAVASANPTLSLGDGADVVSPWCSLSAQLSQPTATPGFQKSVGASRCPLSIFV